MNPFKFFKSKINLISKTDDCGRISYAVRKITWRGTTRLHALGQLSCGWLYTIDNVNAWDRDLSTANQAYDYAIGNRLSRLEIELLGAGIKVIK